MGEGMYSSDDLQRTDPASRQRGRPTDTGQQIPDPNSWKESNI
jgi:hypothetical protein